jgi:lincosamide nucleotidyltransferase A/C/D/E
MVSSALKSTKAMRRPILLRLYNRKCQRTLSLTKTEWKAGRHTALFGAWLLYASLRAIAELAKHVRKECREARWKPVIRLLKLLEHEKIGVVVDGGWGVDALLGQQSRPHEDLDLAIEHKDVPKLRKLFEGEGYKEVPQPDSSDFNFVLGNARGQKVDVHSYTFDAYGKNVYGIPYPTESLTGTGSIQGHAVRCISAEWVLRFHMQYGPDENDFKDVHALCAKFGLAIPEIYVR